MFEYNYKYYKELTADRRIFVVSKRTVLYSVTYPVLVNTSSVSASILVTLTRYVSKYNKLLLQFIWCRIHILKNGSRSFSFINKLQHLVNYARHTHHHHPTRFIDWQYFLSPSLSQSQWTFYSAVYNSGHGQQRWREIKYIKYNLIQKKITLMALI